MFSGIIKINAKVIGDQCNRFTEQFYKQVKTKLKYARVFKS